ncbi:hypothetical protein GWI33_020005 [Rhynchophorus ferrugineus]|uniref:Transposase n=1 Tax=Rhynchophorus ferrugineus TaxID=354439 RepID=A0A834HSD4_RHYFE|nr:hypothetical protein GWI33_020005 [Rhynchophorus ferrugineus]
MASILWNAHGIIFIDYLRKERTINRDYYIALLDRLKEKKVLLHHDNAMCHKSVKTMANPPYSPNLAPSDYCLFSDLKRMLAGKKFSSNEEVIAETEA